MQLLAQLDTVEHALNVRREGDTVTAEVDGRRYELTVQQPENGVVMMVYENRVYDFRTAVTKEAVQVTLDSQEFEVRLVDPKAFRRSGAGGAGDTEGAIRIMAPMPGKVVKILVTEGDEVEANSAIVIVEAMKMQNEMKTPRAGKVTAIKVSEGATVNGGELLVTIE